MGSRRAGLVALQLVDRVAQRAVPPVERRVSWISDPDYGGNAFHLFRHAVETRSDLEHVWLVGPGAPVERIRRDFERWGGPGRGHRLRVRPRRSARGYLDALRSARTFHTHGTYPTVRSAHRRHVVSLWHGAPIKAIGALNRITPNPHPTFGTLHLAPSEVYRSIVAAAFRAGHDDVLLTAFPRCDVLARPHWSTPTAAALRSALGVDPDRPLVLWLPTYRVAVGEARTDARSFLDDLAPGLLDDLARASAEAGCSIVIKLHPYDRLAAGPAPALPPGVGLVTDAQWRALEVELYDALAVVDGLLTDVSSVLVDLLPTSLPLGVVGFDPATYTRDVVIPVEAVLRSARLHDLGAPGATEAFFGAAAAGPGRAPPVDDLSAWLSSAPLGGGCERVLAATGL